MEERVVRQAVRAAACIPDICHHGRLNLCTSQEKGVDNAQ